MNLLVEKFLNENDRRRRLEEYFKSPSENQKKSLQKDFNEFYLRVKFLSYFSKSLRFVAQDFDKKVRKVNNNVIFTGGSNEELQLENFPDEKTLEEHEIQHKSSRVEEYFERKSIHEIISNLTPRQKEIVYLAYIKRLSDKEIANFLNVSTQTINKQRNVILTKIKRRVV